jgi:predicted lipopolysaccharide heptosyltransferase III
MRVREGNANGQVTPVAAVVNILLLQLKRIGDLMLTTPAIAALRAKFPEANLTLVVAGECGELVPAVTGVDHTIVMRRGALDLGASLAVARGKFDCCVDFTRTDRSAFLTLLSRAKRRIVARRIKSLSRLRASLYNEFVVARLHDMHTVDYNLALLQPLGIQDASRAIRLDLPARARENAGTLRKKHSIGDSYMLFHPGSARPEKFWEPQRWTEVIEYTRNHRRLDLVLTGGTGRLEQAHLAKIKSELHQPVTDLSGKTDLLTLAALIEQARLLVTVDSAPMHLAAATRTPQVVLFGPTNPFHWRPRESPVAILQGASAVPVTELVAKQPRMPMKQISTQAVIDAINGLLSSPVAQGS